MVTIKLGSTTDVYRILGEDTNTLLVADVEQYLIQAERKIKARNFNSYMEDLVYVSVIGRTGNTRRSYSTYFDIKDETTISVYLNGEKLTSGDDYTTSGNEITISSSVAIHPNDILVLKYTPEFFDDYANYLAAKKLMDTGLVDTSNETAAGATRANILQELNEYERIAMSKPFVGRYKDHNEPYNDVW